MASFFNSQMPPSPEKSNTSNLPPPYSMPTPSTSGWNMQSFHWNSAEERPSFVQFGKAPDPPISPPLPPLSIPIKRKSGDDVYLKPTKRMITEEMAADLDNLHLSSSFTNHNISPTTSTADISDVDDSSYFVHMSPEEMERRLKTAQRITICEQIKNLEKPDTIVPKVLLDRVERPYCTALVLWQPPSKILSATAKATEESSDDEDEGMKKSMPLPPQPLDMEEMLPDDFLDNNNTSSIDLNNLSNNNNHLDGMDVL